MNVLQLETLILGIDIVPEVTLLYFTLKILSRFINST